MRAASDDTQLPYLCALFSCCYDVGLHCDNNWHVSKSVELCAC